MSQREPTFHEQQQIRKACPTCSAKPFEWCKTKKGSWTAFLHSRRPV